MVTLSIKKWGNSNGVRFTKDAMEFLGVHTDDKINILFEEKDGKKRLVIEADKSKNELTIEELFRNYEGERFHTVVQDLGEAVGNEKW